MRDAERAGPGGCLWAVRGERLTRELDAGYDRGPLHGVAIGVKDLMDVRGLVTTFGSRRQTTPAAEDAGLVRRLRAAGSVVLGKTTCLEYGYGTAHPAVGQTHNPWNPAGTAGGSSGGSAATVADGQGSGRHGDERPDDLAEQSRIQLEIGFALPATTHVRGQRYHRHLGHLLRDTRAEAGASATPTESRTAPEENLPLDDPEGAAEMRYIAPYNLTGLPALTLPCGLSENGTPVGLQLAAGPHADADLLAIGAGLESLFPPRKPSAHPSATQLNGRTV